MKRLTIKFWLLRKNTKKIKTPSRFESLIYKASYRSVTTMSLTKPEQRVLVKKLTTQAKLNFLIQPLC